MVSLPQPEDQAGKDYQPAPVFRSTHSPAFGAPGLPSPSTSPSLTPKEPGSPKSSRKRQRSNSMASDSDPSLKRSVADTAPALGDQSLSASHPNNLSALSISDPIDDLDPASLSILHHNSLPSPSQKLIQVENTNNVPMQPGQTWYLVSRRWYRRWRKACSGEVDKEGPVDEKDLGPVDNSSIIMGNGSLMSHCMEHVDVEFVNGSVWELFEKWYGRSLHPISRKVIEVGVSEEKILELYPPRLNVLLLHHPNLPDQSGPSARSVTVSKKDTLKYICAALAQSVRPDQTTPDTPYRVWKLNASLEFQSLPSPTSRLKDQAELLSDADGHKTASDAYIENDDTFIVEFQHDGKWNIHSDDANADSKSGAVFAPPNFAAGPPLFEDGDYFSKMSTSFSKSRAFNGPSSSFSRSPGPSSSSSLTTSSFFGLIGTRMQPAYEPGTLGLGNMGNTCFMNSALQCLVHTQELCQYFLLGVYKEELNPDNPLGMRGAIAEAFGSLLERIWSPTNTSSTTSHSYYPREFKQQLQRFAPQFTGYQQHDSQELVAFLLDGLHEDLNRVLKKPYVENPNWEGGGDRELVELARKSWEGYMKRNDSVIVDLFQGQYQSTLVCPECQKVSITFDPFMYLTLPLPVKRKWQHAIYYVPWDLEKPHQKVYVEINRDASFKELRALLGRWMGAEPEKLLTMEIFSHSFYKNLDDSHLCGDMAENDVIVCFELPCNSQQNRIGSPYKPGSNEPFILPLFLSDAPALNAYRFVRHLTVLFGYPFVVVIDREQATSVEAIYEAVVERLQRWTTHAKELYSWELGSRPRSSTSAESMEEVPIQITGFPPIESITEIKENGDVVTVDVVPPAEDGEATDEKQVEAEEGAQVTTNGVIEHEVDDDEPRKLHAKTGLFELLLQTNNKEMGRGFYGHGFATARYESWESRQEVADSNPVLLREGDALVCQFDEHMKALFFGEDRSRYPHARWDIWEEFAHPEYIQSQKTSATLQSRGITLQDCLEEFTREEQLGEDDLWYCPRCKKHQQATKKFDLWKAPDVLVVHLKRFSNSRILRDKIDAFVEFPLRDLDLTEMVGERKVTKKLLAEGVDIEALGLTSLDEDLIYDLYAVDEHLGGLGGGHYRAYALNHTTGKWYHFDDSFVSEAQPAEAVTSNAYLLFYRRRTERPLGGKTHAKIENARLRPQSPGPEPMTIDNQLPTPPNESETPSYVDTGMSELSALTSFTHILPQQTPHVEGWPPRPISPTSSALPFHDGLDQFDNSFTYDDPLQAANQHYDFPDPSSKDSPTSSVEAQPDYDDATWPDITEPDSPGSVNWQGEPEYSPDSSVSEVNPLSDANAHKALDGNENDDNHEGEDDDASRTDIHIEETDPL